MENNNQKPNLYRVCQDIGRIEGKLGEMDKKLDKVCENHDKRINDLEKTTDEIMGRASVFGMIGGAIIAIVGIIIAWFKK